MTTAWTRSRSSSGWFGFLASVAALILLALAALGRGVFRRTTAA